MRLLALSFAILIPLVGCTHAQTRPPIMADAETEVRAIDDTERLAVLHGDTDTLRRVWASDFMVNTPFNTITTSAEEVLGLVAAGVIRYDRFDRQIERTLQKGNTVFVMGTELVVPYGPDGQPTEPIHRRFTNVWLRDGSAWRLSARHAHVLD